jgi:hypothetical protein
MRPASDHVLKDRGVSYVMVLFAVAVLGTVSLSFALMTGLQRDVASNYEAKAEAHYLARAGLNKGIWRVLNEPGFLDENEGAPISDAFEDMPVTYVVQKATNNGSILVTSTGSVGNATSLLRHLTIPFAGASYLYGQHLVYDTALDSSDVKPWHRAFEDPYWSDAAETVDIGHAKALWIELEACPLTAEMVMGALDEGDDINLAVWDGMSWAHQMEFSASAEKEVRCFGIAYESLSGRALVVGRYDSTNTARWTVWDGSEWVYDPPLPGPQVDAGSRINYVVMEASPHSNEILIAILDNSRDITLFRWDGAAFTNLGEIEANATTDDQQQMDIVYEQLSGEAMVIWGKGGKPSWKYRTWDGSTLGPEEDLPTVFSGSHTNIRACSDPTSDYIFVAATGGNNDLHVAVWDGNAWVDSRSQLEVSVEHMDRLCFDAAWESPGSEVVVTWSVSGANTLRYCVWAKGTPLSGVPVQVGPDFSDKLSLMQLCPIAGTNKVMLLVVNEGEQMYHSLWNGAVFADDPPVLLEEKVTVKDKMPFDLAEPLASLGKSLIGHWKLDETSGLNAADSSGHGNHGTLTNMTGDEWTTGQIDGGLQFDGDNDYIAGLGDCPTGNFTVACWAIDTDGGGWKVLYSADQEIWFGVNSGASPSLWIDVGGNGNGANTAAGTWTQDTWHHVAGTWDGTTVHLYIDGIDMPITTYGTPENPRAKAAVIGAWSKFPTDENWFGTIDDVRLYNRALNAGEISALAGG